MAPPSQDPSIETRLLVVAEMLERAVAEVRRAMVDVRSDIRTDDKRQTAVTAQGLTPPAVAGNPNPDDDARSADVE